LRILFLENPMKKTALTLQMAALFTLAVSATPSQATLVTYADFSSTAGLTLTGNAATTTTSDGTVLRLTPASGGQSGAAYSTTAITLGSNATFSTDFKFRFTGSGGIDPADGITFVLAASPGGLGGAGYGMGYQGVTNSIAIEFDTYNNAGYGIGNNDGDSSNHISIDRNGALTNDALTNVYGNGSCGYATGSPAQNPYNVAGCMSNGDLWSVNIVYDGSNLSVNVFDPAEGVTFTALSNYAIDISSLLGTNDAYVGFTAATGAGWENHDIVNWQFANTTELATTPTDVPEPYTLALVGAALAACGWVRRRKA
jgi:hypothetical protein